MKTYHLHNAPNDNITSQENGKEILIEHGTETAEDT